MVLYPCDIDKRGKMVIVSPLRPEQKSPPTYTKRDHTTEVRGACRLVGICREVM